jgi:hypothetical protein
MKMVIAMLLATFDIESVATADGVPAEERMAFTMQPVGLRMRLRARSAGAAAGAGAAAPAGMAA